MFQPLESPTVGEDILTKIDKTWKNIDAQVPAIRDLFDFIHNEEYKRLFDCRDDNERKEILVEQLSLIILELRKLGYRPNIAISVYEKNTDFENIIMTYLKKWQEHYQIDLEGNEDRVDEE